MGKDIKIGLVIGIIALLFLFGYWFNRSTSHKETTEEAPPALSDKSAIVEITPGSRVSPELLDKEPEWEAGEIVSDKASEKAPGAGRPVWPKGRKEGLRAESEGVVEQGGSPLAPTPQTEVRKYTVVKEDTLSRIAKKVYGDSSKWVLIRDANSIKNERSLRIGQVLVIPPVSGTRPEAPALEEPLPAPTVAPESAVASEVRTHKVAKGDTLYNIARKYYNNVNKWKEIADANGIRNQKNLKVGRTLRIP